MDCDGVLSNFTKAYAALLIQVSGRNLLPEGFTGDDTPDFPDTWYWERKLGYTKAEEDAVWDIIKSGDTFWANLEPLPTATAALEHLSSLQRHGHDVYFLTHRFGNDAKWQTEFFLHENGMDNPTVILSGKKDLVINGLELDFFIDDNPDTVAQVTLHCKVKHLYLKSAPYNRKDLGWEKAGVNRVLSIAEALEDAGLWDRKSSSI
ncbi:MAG: hypothetical protein LC723_14665 [Actinobacteria bacterium]|nr:hypothetical protein [Actinomycetota bacterium]